MNYDQQWHTCTIDFMEEYIIGTKKWNRLLKCFEDWSDVELLVAYSIDGVSTEVDFKRFWPAAEVQKRSLQRSSFRIENVLMPSFNFIHDALTKPDDDLLNDQFEHFNVFSGLILNNYLSGLRCLGKSLNDVGTEAALDEPLCAALDFTIKVPAVNVQKYTGLIHAQYVLNIVESVKDTVLRHAASVKCQNRQQLQPNLVCIIFVSGFEDQLISWRQHTHEIDFQGNGENASLIAFFDDGTYLTQQCINEMDEQH